MSDLGIEMSQRPGPRISVFSSPSSSPSFSSWLPSWRNGQDYSALPSTSNPTAPEVFSGSKTSRRRILQAGVVVVILLAGAGLLHVSRDKYPTQNAPLLDQWEETQASGSVSTGGVTSRPMWGWHEDNGWRPTSDMGLADLGEIAEERYRVGFNKGPQGTEFYFKLLHDFASSLSPPYNLPILSSLYSHLPASHNDLLPKPFTGAETGPPSMISYKTIHQTDKTKDSLGEETAEWIRMNEKDGWRLNFLDDDAGLAWMRSVFEGTDVEWAWNYMHRGVLRADFLRYLLPLIIGGVYSDIDTRPLRPIEQWGHVDVEYLDLSRTDGSDWRSTLSTSPAVVVSIDVNVHAKMDWHTGWPRALGICQWTLSGAPNHPIFLDAVRRVVNSTRVVEKWENDRAAQIRRLETERPGGWEQKVDELKAFRRESVMEVMEWTGPGLFSDAVVAFLLARYNVTWHRLRALDHPLRIGDVLILPITAFSPGGEPDFGAEGPDSPQADVLHDFRGSWKSEGWR